MNTREVLDKEDFIKKHKDIPGEKHGKLTLLATKPIKLGEDVPLEGSNRRNPIANRTMYNVKCDCGKETWVTISAWRRNKAKSCGKCMEPEIGKRYGKLTVIKEAPGRPRPHKNGRLYMRRFWLCKCDCGNEAVIDQHHITTGHTTSCGRCNDVNHDHIPESIWKSLRSIAYNVLNRCTNVESPSFWNYGGRGIECLLGDTPQEVALNLYKIPGYEDGKQLDRIDNNGHYTVNNLRWATPSENADNRIFRENVDKDSISLRPLLDSTFQAVCKSNKLNSEEFLAIRLPVEILSSSDYIPKDLSIYVHTSNKDDIGYYIKRILNFWSRWSGKEYKVYIPTGLYAKDVTTNTIIPLLRIIKSDVIKTLINENNFKEM